LIFNLVIMKKLQSAILVLLIILTACSTGNSTISKPDNITVACYYFPNYHIRDKYHLRLSRQPYLDNQSEWVLVRGAKPRFEGHQQPKVPAWGYTDEKDPAVMAMKIDVATDNGINVFIFDWYNYNGKPFLNQCLDDGFLKAKNTNKIKFALMWANHNWTDLFPSKPGVPQDVLYPGAVSAEAFEKIGDEIVRDYFARDNYWLIDGKAYFSIFDIKKFVEGFGSMEATKKAMNSLNAKAVKAGLKGVHWNFVVRKNPVLPGTNAPKNTADLIKRLGFSTATSYVWINHANPKKEMEDYNDIRNKYFAYWEKVKLEYAVPYYPNVSMGWDSSPRTNQDMEWNPKFGYPYTGIIINNTPANFKEALQQTKDKLLAVPNGPRALTINSWNEWTEGSYLEPDAVNGMKYLEAVKEVFETK